MPLWRISAIAVLAAAGWAQHGTTVAEVVATVHGALDRGQSDGNLAKALRKFKLVERLEDFVVEELESEGAGPKAMTELERLRDSSRAFPEPNPAPVFPHDPAPSAAEQRRIIEKARGIALEKSKSLPDFICMQTVRRFENTRGYWELKDTLEVKLTYFEQKEEYQLISRNRKPVASSYLDVGGTLTEGEFGSTLLSIFTPEYRTDFRWDHWTTLRKRPAHVFTFRISPDFATYRMEVRRSQYAPLSAASAGQHGFIYVDAETSQVVRIVADADHIPPGFPVRASNTVLDYGFVEVGEREYLLPLRADVHMAADFIQVRNLVEFHDYRKFAGESKITFH